MRQIKVPNPMTGGKGLLSVMLAVLCVFLLAPSLFAHENPLGEPPNRVVGADIVDNGHPWIEPQRSKDGENLQAVESYFLVLVKYHGFELVISPNCQLFLLRLDAVDYLENTCNYGDSDIRHPEAGPVTPSGR